MAGIAYYSITMSVFTMCGTMMQQKLDVPNIFPISHEAWVLDILETDLEAADAEASPCNSYWREWLQDDACGLSIRPCSKQSWKEQKYFILCSSSCCAFMSLH